jgi:hypothetical protein
MKKWYLILLLFAIGGGVMAQNTLPDAVSKAFEKKFPKAKKVRWAPGDIDEYEADFEMDSLVLTSIFDIKGNWIQTEVDMPVIKLPQAVALAVKKSYPKGKISHVAKITHYKKVPHYEVEIKTADRIEDVYFDENGVEVN